MLRRDDAWIWDSWIADDGEQLPPVLPVTRPAPCGDPAQRHVHATIGACHLARSHRVDRPRHRPGAAVSGWDDLALWTGSVVRGDDGVLADVPHRDQHRRARTAGPADRRGRCPTTCSPGGASVDRAGARWPDPPWYCTLDERPRRQRDVAGPVRVPRPGGDGWRMLITARAATVTDRNDDGVLAEARSDDLRELGSSARRSALPGAGFGQLEVAQVQPDRRARRCWSSPATRRSMTASAVATSGALLHLVGGRRLPRPAPGTSPAPGRSQPNRTLFAAPLVQQPRRHWAFVGFRNLEAVGIYGFEIVDPVPVVLRDGRLVGAD